MGDAKTRAEAEQEENDEHMRRRNASMTTETPEEGSDEWHGLSGSIPEPKEEAQPSE